MEIEKKNVDSIIINAFQLAECIQARNDSDHTLSLLLNSAEVRKAINHLVRKLLTEQHHTRDSLAVHPDMSRIVEAICPALWHSDNRVQLQYRECIADFVVEQAIAIQFDCISSLL